MAPVTQRIQHFIPVRRSKRFQLIDEGEPSASYFAGERRLTLQSERQSALHAEAKYPVSRNVKVLVIPQERSFHRTLLRGSGGRVKGGQADLVLVQRESAQAQRVIKDP